MGDVGRWFCRTCETELARTLRRRSPCDGEAARGEAVGGEAAGGEAVGGETAGGEICPCCGAEAPEPLRPCPTCAGGWRRAAEAVCPKCHLRHLGELRRFVRGFPPAALRDLETLMAGRELAWFA